ncbi:hypothetical protein Droror1_Dr00011904 [Drosera rotundifolia]
MMRRFGLRDGEIEEEEDEDEEGRSRFYSNSFEVERAVMRSRGILKRRSVSLTQLSLSLVSLRQSFQTYRMLSNMYAADGQWEESAKMRKLVKRLGNEDEAISSWLEFNNEVRRFVVGDIAGLLEGWDNKILHVMIRHMKAERHKPYLDNLLHDF